MRAAKAPVDTSPELEDGEDPELPGLAVPAVPDELRLHTVPALTVCTVAAPAETVTAVDGGATIDEEEDTAINENLAADQPTLRSTTLKNYPGAWLQLV